MIIRTPYLDAGNFESQPSNTTTTYLPTVLMLICWALTLFTFSLPDRVGGLGALDLVAQLKIFTRLLSLVILGIMYFRCTPSLKTNYVTFCLLPLGLFIGWSSLSVLWSPLPNVSVGQLISFTVLVLLSANIANYWKSTESTSQVMLHLSIVLLVYSAGLTAFRFLMPELGSGVRSGNYLVHATVAGSTASLGLILILGARLIWGWQWSKSLFVPAVFLHSLQLYLAHSRMAIAATFLACFLLYYIFINRELLWLAIFGASLFGALYLIADPGMEIADSILLEGTEFAQRDEHSSISNLSGRTEMWEAIWTSIKVSPWIGHGYFISSPSGSMEVWGMDGNWTAHNLVLQVLVSTGLIGTLLFLWAMWKPMQTMISSLGIDQQSDSLIYFLLVLGCWFFIWGLTNESMAGPLQPESVVFFAMLGVGIGTVSSLIGSGKHDNNFFPHNTLDDNPQK